ncbi:hypothetical protein [Rosistilla oblonga]|uniref:hypothetical protein n=1 Tax=Rosistilla oblonga TaxID=2527990 RepID=UPI003A97FA04
MSRTIGCNGAGLASVLMMDDQLSGPLNRNGYHEEVEMLCANDRTQAVSLR